MRLAALRGRAVEAQAAALRAAEAALARKRGALAQAEEAALAAQAALAHSRADREAVDTQVASLSAQYLRWLLQALLQTCCVDRLCGLARWLSECWV